MDLHKKKSFTAINCLLVNSCGPQHTIYFVSACEDKTRKNLDKVFQQQLKSCMKENKLKQTFSCALK